MRHNWVTLWFRSDAWFSGKVARMADYDDSTLKGMLAGGKHDSTW